MKISLSTGSLRQALDDYASMGVDATIQVQDTTIGINGTFDHLFPVENLSATVTAEVPNPAQLGDYLDIPLPDLPPSRVRAQVHREQGPASQYTFIFKEFDGTIGDSDVAGTWGVTIGGERPRIFARWHSRKLDWGYLIDPTPDPEEMTEDRDRILSDEPIDFTHFNKLDTDIEYQAKRVQVNDFPLDDFLLEMVLEDGNLHISRLDFGFSRGTVAIELNLKAKQSPVQAKLTTHFDQVELSELLAPFEVADQAFGVLGGRGTLWMRGESLANLFASPDGGMYVTLTGGKLDALFIELAGLDFVETLIPDTMVPIDCVYMDLQARSGIVTMHPFLLDTTDTKFRGSGKIDLRQERIDLTLTPYPKDFSLLSSRGPLHVTGTFKDPSFSVNPSFPFPDFGRPDDHPLCSGTIDELRKIRKRTVESHKLHFEPVD